MKEAPTGRALVSVVRKETVISTLINTVISLAFFLLVFGTRGPVPVASFRPDFFPQSFMIGLMASLIPGAIAARGAGRRTLFSVARRSVLVAFVAAIVLGGGAWLACDLLPQPNLDYGQALILKLVFGAGLAALATPFAVRYGYAALSAT